MGAGVCERGGANPDDSELWVNPDDWGTSMNPEDAVGILCRGLGG